ncbi:hypothetical protein EJ110_NYTH54370 [Nymphaea thermarum]|nr:hypothetical protein EJ110_NYTH54370 [Nymphaea thermarum]
MQSLRSKASVVWRLQPPFSLLISRSKTTSSFSDRNGGRVADALNNSSDSNEWNEAWESSWLPEDVVAQSRAPWEVDVHADFTAAEQPVVFPSQLDSDTRAFVEEMSENWNQRRGSKKPVERSAPRLTLSEKDPLKDYRIRKQAVHAALWMKEIEKELEAKLGTPAGRDDIDKLLDSCSEIFDQGSNEIEGYEVPSTSQFNNKPEGWESTSKPQDGNVFNLTQKEDDILLQEFERRIAFTKFQVVSFIKSHIFSRRRPVDGWKYMIEELGPHAKSGKGSVARLPSSPVPPN